MINFWYLQKTKEQKLTERNKKKDGEWEGERQHKIEKKYNSKRNMYNFKFSSRLIIKKKLMKLILMLGFIYTNTSKLFFNLNSYLNSYPNI